MSDIQFTPEQEIAASMQGGALLVSAGAGSGKTKVLVERLVRRVTDPASHCSIDRFLVITFTQAAAAELRNRILKALGAIAAQDPANRYLRRQMALCARAQIGTIDSICLSILRDNAHLLGLNPGFRVADEQEADVLRENAVQKLLEDCYSQLDAHPEFASLVDAVTSGGNDGELAALILRTYETLRSHVNPEAWAREQIDRLQGGEWTDAGQTVWGQALLGDAGRRARYWRDRLKRTLEDAQSDELVMKGYGDSLTASVASAEGLVKAIESGWDAACAYGEVAFPRAKGCKNADAESVKNRRAACQKALGKITARFCVPSAVLASDLKKAAPAAVTLLELALRFNSVYAAEKRRRNVIDFGDEEHLALGLLTDPATGEPTETAREISARYEEIMIDEYQDVNDVQEQIFRAISRGGQNLFLVGDVKQSIYRFRLADPTLFLRRYEAYPDAENAVEGQGRRVMLNRNFRSRAGVLDAVNDVFRNILSKQVGEMEYTPREYLYCGNPGSENPEPCMELDIVSGGSDGAASEAIFAARRIRRLLDETKIPDGKAEDGGSRFRSVRPGDIAILMRSRTRQKLYADALEAYGIPVDLAANQEFFQTEEITIAVSLLTVLDNPNQDVPLASVMMSPVWGFTPDELTRLRTETPGGSLYDAVVKQERTDDHCGRFLTALRALRTLAPELSADALVWEVYTRTSLPAVMGAMPGGSLRRQNLMTLYSMAQKFESDGYKGLFGFIGYLKKLREQGKNPKTEQLSAENGVHMLTIHASKGLEYPIVLLCDTSHQFNMEDLRSPVLLHPKLGVGSMCVDAAARTRTVTLPRMAVEEAVRRESLSEEMRLLYVAMTRAREKLIVTCTRKNPEKELEKLAESAGVPAAPEVLLDCKSVGDWLLLTALTRPEGGVLHPGTAVPLDTKTGEPWVIRVIPPLEEDDFRLPQTASTPAEETQTGISPEEIGRRLSYQYPWQEAQSIPSKLTATELKGGFREAEAAEDAQPVESTKPLPPLRTPSFLRNRSLTPAEAGVAQHLAMQYADYGACLTVEGARQQVEQLLSKGVLTPAQAQAVQSEKMTRFLLSEPGRRLLRAGKLYREMKFSLLVPAKTFLPTESGEEVLLQGVVDCCFEEDGGLVVLDFKTDRVTKAQTEARGAHYAGQLSAYAYAMERILGKPVREKLVYFFFSDSWVSV